MSRSRRKTPVLGITVRGWRRGEAADKRQWHRALRAAFRRLLVRDGEEVLQPHVREHSDPWSMAKDGKRWQGFDMPARWWRK